MQEMFSQSMNDLQTWEHKTEGDFLNWEHQEQEEFDNFIQDTQQKLDSVKDLDLGALAMDEARDLNHKLRDQTGLDLSQIVP